MEEEPDWEQLNEKDREKTISNSLKKLDNVKKKRMSTFILKDMLGSDGEFSLRGIKESHLQTVKKEEMKINNIYRAVKYFKHKMAIRCARLKANIEHSKNDTFSKWEYSWRDEYYEEMKIERGE